MSKTTVSRRETTVSPADCKHVVRLFVESHRSSPPPESHLVTVCRDCGTFFVTGRKEGISFAVAFDLPTWELVVAASRYAWHLEKGGE